jgi:large subunit ribosomal protein L23
MNILLKPIITEKLTAAGEKLGCYGFIVDRRANKLQIRSAVEKQYGVKVEEVRTMRKLGKLKVRYTKAGFYSGRTNSVKKAIVKLVKGETIDFYSSI